MTTTKVYHKIGGVQVAAGYGIPDDRTFRAAWKLNAAQTAVEVDMTLARAVYRELITQAVQKPLEVMAQLIIQAQVTGSTPISNAVADVVNLPTGTYSTAELQAHQAELADIANHPDIEQAATPEELKNLTLYGLTI